MPTDKIKVQGIIEHLERYRAQSDELEPTIRLWRSTSTDLERDDFINYAEWNLPPIPREIVEQYGVDLDD